MVKYCPNCGEETDQDSIYCLNCGKKLPESGAAKPPAPGWETPQQPPAPRPYQAPGYKPIYQPQPYHPSMKAPMGERCVALLVDNFISGLLSYVCIGIFYECMKDGIRDGQSFGKGLMNLRVVDYNTGLPATIGQSFIRNCLCGWIDVCCCYLVALLSDDGRRIGDNIAGTIVILDR
jgi:hypothetical protein